MKTEQCGEVMVNRVETVKNYFSRAVSNIRCAKVIVPVSQGGQGVLFCKFLQTSEQGVFNIHGVPP
ncbi:MAG: hypothetical protein KJ900_05260 [Proteobacteria bacterium]|nr:hypothetical protein [Pseudomonadota bacterium]MBU4029828.1 hypothetical protein [Pseudomonadota bacterium]MBU4042290.1 hypothetical protein [Pseudomonadota bacterium]MBU4169332.1 hypothetical protein [Pseudomonadota bacterium]MCG2745835.1 hypothetical protein [Desulfobacteraceae bacterium]